MLVPTPFPLRALRKLRDFEGHRWNDGGKSKNSNSRGQANAAGDAMRGFLQIIRAARAGRRWRERVRKPIVVYGTSDGLLVVTDVCCCYCYFYN